MQYNAIGYHGCPRTRFEELEETGQWPKSITGWLGPGIYFWDNDQSTARWWADTRYSEQNPTVIRAKIDLSDCLDFTTVFAQNLLKKLRGFSEENPALANQLKKLQQQGSTEDGALIRIARQRLEQKGTSFSSIRVPVHMQSDESTMETVGSTSLLVSFRMVIVVFDPAIIQEYEVCDDQ